MDIRNVQNNVLNVIIFEIDFTCKITIVDMQSMNILKT